MRGGTADAFAREPESVPRVVSYGALQAGEPVVAEPFGETDDGGATRAGASRHLGDRAERDGFGVVEHDCGNSPLGRRQ